MLGFSCYFIRVILVVVFRIYRGDKGRVGRGVWRLVRRVSVTL